MKKVLVTVLAFVMALTAVNIPQRASAAVAKIYVKGEPDKTYTKAKPKFLYVGGKKWNFDYNINGKTSKMKGTWSSTNEKIVKVDKEGKAKAVGNGEAQILYTYKLNGVTETLRTYVKCRTRAEEVEIEVVSPKNFDGTLAIGKTLDINRTLTPDADALEINSKIKSTYKTYGTLYDDEDCTVEHDGSVAEMGKGMVVTGISDGVVYAKANARNSKTNFDYAIDSNVIEIIVGEGDPDKDKKEDDAYTDSAAQVDTNKIKVTSATEITKITVKRGNTVMTLKAGSPEISEDKHSAIVSLPGNYMEATYTVFINDAEKGIDVECTTRKIDKIVLDSKYAILDKLIQTDGTYPKATVKYRLYDQWGLDITDNPNFPYTDFTAGGVFRPTSAGVLTYQYENSYITVGQKYDVVLTYVSGTKVVTMKEEVEIAKPAFVDTVEFKGIYKYDGLTEKYMLMADQNTCNISEGDPDIVAYGGEAKNTKTSGAYYVLFKATNQYGGNAAGAGVGYSSLVVNLSGGTTGLSLATVRKGTSTVIESINAITIDNEQYLAYPLNAGKIKEGKAMLVVNTISSTSSAKKNQTFTITIAPQKGIKTITIAQTETLYETKETYLDYQVADTDGNDITSYATLVKYCGLTDNGTYATFEKNSTFIKSTGGSTFAWVKQADGSAKLRYVPATLAGSSGSSTSASLNLPVYYDSITTMQASVNIKVFNFSIFSKPIPSKIYGINQSCSLGALINGSKVIIRQKDLQIVDQYGAEMQQTNIKNSGYKVRVSDFAPVNNSFAANSAVNTDVTLSSAADTANTGSNLPIATLTTGSLAGTTTIRFQLVDGTGKLVDGSGYVATVKSYGSDALVKTGYTVEDFGLLYNGDNSGNKAFVVYGVSADGTKIRIPDDRITVYPLNGNDNANRFLVSGTSGGAVAYAIDPDAATLQTLGYAIDSNTNSRTATLKYTIVVDDGAGSTIEAKVKISDAAPYAADVKITPTGTLVGSSTIWSQLTSNNYVTAYDQYGRAYSDFTNDVVRVQLAVTNSFSVEKNGTRNARVTAGTGDIVANIYINSLPVISVPITIN
jgi:hypothetical protein